MDCASGAEGLDAMEEIRYLAQPSRCGYLSEQTWQLEYELVSSLSAAEYAERMDRGWRRFGSTLFLREVFDCPIINYFEYFYHPHGSDLDYRPEFAPRDLDFLRSYCRNAMLLLDLQNCQAGYCPTHWQRSLLPQNYQDKLEVIFDGIDPQIWRETARSEQQAGPQDEARFAFVTYECAVNDSARRQSAA